MADKKSFLMYKNWGKAISKMSDEQAGKLIKAIYELQDDPDVNPEDDSISFVFEIIKERMMEDAEAYEEVCEKRREAGKLGGAPRKNQNAKKQPNGFENKQNNQMVFKTTKNNQKQAKQPDTDTDTDTEMISSNEDIKKKPPTEAKKKAAVYYPNDEKLDRTFRDFITMRTRIRAPLTDRGIELAMKDVAKYSEGDNDRGIAVLEQSIKNSWKGLYPLKEPLDRASPVKGSIDWDNV